MTAERHRRVVVAVTTQPIQETFSMHIFSKRVLSLIQPGMIVRSVMCGRPVTLDSGETWGINEAIYFRIIRVKDGTIWGEALPTYRLCSLWGWKDGKPVTSTDICGVQDGQIMTFRLNAIIAIPLSWQPRRIAKLLRKFMREEKQPNSPAP